MRLVDRWSSRCNHELSRLGNLANFRLISVNKWEREDPCSLTYVGSSLEKEDTLLNGSWHECRLIRGTQYHSRSTRNNQQWRDAEWGRKVGDNSRRIENFISSIDLPCVNGSLVWWHERNRRFLWFFILFRRIKSSSDEKKAICEREKILHYWLVSHSIAVICSFSYDPRSIGERVKVHWNSSNTQRKQILTHDNVKKTKAFVNQVDSYLKTPRRNNFHKKSTLVRSSRSPWLSCSSISSSCRSISFAPKCWSNKEHSARNKTLLVLFRCTSPISTWPMSEWAT